MKKRMMTLAMTLVMALSLAVPAGAVGTAEVTPSATTEDELEMVQLLFTRRSESHVYGNDGEEITEGFLSEHQANYDAGNFTAIVDDFKMKELSASYPYEDDGIMPLLTVRHSATGTARFTYTYNNKSYTGSVSMRISALMNDANNYFSKIEGVSMTDFKNGGSGASFNSLTMGHVSMHYETSVVNVTLKFSLYGTSFYKNWAAGMSNSSSTLKLTPIP